MDQPVSMAERFASVAYASLRRFGIEPEPGKKYKLMSLYDTQSVPATANTTIDFFATSTSQRDLHAQLESGCNLREVGKVDHGTDFLVLGYGIEFPDLDTSTAAIAADLAKLYAGGFMRELVVSDQQEDRYRPLSAMGLNRGFSIELLETDGATAVDFDHATAGQPGIPGGGLMLAEFERLLISGGESIKAVVGCNAPAGALSAALPLRLHLLGIRIS